MNADPINANKQVKNKLCKYDDLNPKEQYLINNKP